MGRGRALAFNLMIASLPVLLIGFVPNVWFFIPLSIITGATISIWNILLMSTYQSLIPQELYGRIHGARRTIVWGLMPLGAVAGGFIALGGLRLPYIVGGAVSILIVLLSFKRIIEIGESSSQIHS
jgi:MFS family permease